MNTNWEYKLYTTKFTEEELAKILNCVDIRTVIKTQKLSLDFIFNTLLKSLESAEENEITISEILKYQCYTEEDAAAYLQQ
jgi:hypothetical protein